MYSCNICPDRSVARLNFRWARLEHFLNLSSFSYSFLKFFLNISFSSSFWSSGWAACPPGKALTIPLCPEIVYIFILFIFRIQYCTQEIVVFREDIVMKMCRNCIRFPEDSTEIPNHVSSCQFQQEVCEICHHTVSSLMNYST